ncbi:hypothetical protein Sa4125_35490 [Aureimonas sp. SA4125]|nr:hypothetical protein Sa4125_35490 [Aureimonas sp. SA4125]
MFPTEIRSKEKMAIPFAIRADMFSQAVGFIEEDHFQGTFHHRMDFFLDFGANRRMFMGHLPERTWAEVSGRFSLIVR